MKKEKGSAFRCTLPTMCFCPLSLCIPHITYYYSEETRFKLFMGFTINCFLHNQSLHNSCGNLDVYRQEEFTMNRKRRCVCVFLADELVLHAAGLFLTCSPASHECNRAVFAVIWSTSKWDLMEETEIYKKINAMGGFCQFWLTDNNKQAQRLALKLNFVHCKKCL